MWLYYCIHYHGRRGLVRSVSVMKLDNRPTGSNITLCTEETDDTRYHHTHNLGWQLKTKNTLYQPLNSQALYEADDGYKHYTARCPFCKPITFYVYSHWQFITVNDVFTHTMTSVCNLFRYLTSSAKLLKPFSLRNRPSWDWEWWTPVVSLHSSAVLRLL